MQPALTDSRQQPLPSPAKSSCENGFSEEGASSLPEPRNFLVLVVYFVLMRIGWIFKTESIIMPAVLDSLGGAAWLRGCLPLLNRVGQSIPPLLMARRLKVMPRKKWSLVTTSLIMSLSFLALAAAWFSFPTAQSGWLSLVFLAFYSLFFLAMGINALAMSTLQGKLIQAARRGRLLLVANTCGAVASIACAWWLLPGWLRPSGADFHSIFAFTGVCFAAMAFAACTLHEPADSYEQPADGVLRLFAATWITLRQDVDFRRLAVVSALFGSSVILFPHYQALGRGPRLQMDMTSLITWVIVQNIGTALFSLLAGPLADRRGNRLTLQVLLLAICAAPPLALCLSRFGTAAQLLFPLVFVLVGLTPVVIRILSNYTLEICEPSEHPRYLSTWSLCLSAPILLSPLVGGLVDWVGFDAVFLGVTALVFTGWLMTFGLSEPRFSQAVETQQVGEGAGGFGEPT